MIELVIVYCLAANASQCIERRTPMESALPMACIRAGQMQAATFLRDHPKWTASRYRCEVNLPKHADT
jgi:hypothetical protein